GPEWTTVEIPFARLAPVGPSAASAQWAPHEVHWLGITTAPDRHGPFQLEIDDVCLIPRGAERAAPQPEAGPPRTVRVARAAAPSVATWRELARDAAGDGKKPGLPDVVSVAVAIEPGGDRVWFRIGLAQAPNPAWLGVNLAFDLDGNPENGMAWWG